MAGAVLVQCVNHCVIHRWKADILSILTRCVELWYVVYSHNYGHVTVNIQIITVKLTVIMQIYMILQLGWLSSNTERIQDVQIWLIHHWKAAVFSILMMYVQLWYCVYWDKYGQFNCNYFNFLQLKCLYLYTYTTYQNSTQLTRMLKTSAFQWYITQYCKPCMRTAPAQLIIYYFGNYGNTLFPARMVSMATKSCDMSTISLLTRMLNMVKFGLKLTKLQSEVCLFRNIISNCTWLCLNTPVQLASNRHWLRQASTPWKLPSAIKINCLLKLGSCKNGFFNIACLTSLKESSHSFVHSNFTYFFNNLVSFLGCHNLYAWHWKWAYSLYVPLLCCCYRSCLPVSGHVDEIYKFCTNE